MSVRDFKPEYFTIEMDGAVCVLRLNRPPANAHIEAPSHGFTEGESLVWNFWWIIPLLWCEWFFHKWPFYAPEAAAEGAHRHAASAASGPGRFYANRQRSGSSGHEGHNSRYRDSA